MIVQNTIARTIRADNGGNMSIGVLLMWVLTWAIVISCICEEGKDD